MIAAALLVVIAMLGAYTMGGALSNTTKSVAGDTSSPSTKGASDATNSPSNGGNDQQNGCNSPGSTGSAPQGGGGYQSGGSDDNCASTQQGVNDQQRGDSDNCGPAHHDGGDQSNCDDHRTTGDGGQSGGSSTEPGCIYGQAAFDGFYTGGVSTGAGDTSNHGTKVAGNGLQVNTSYYCDVSSMVTDYGLQWYKNGATTFVDGYLPNGEPAEVWLALNTSIGFVVDIHSDHAISASDLAVSGVYGSPAAVGDPGYNGPWVRSLEQVNPCAVRVFLAYQPYSLIYPRGAFIGDVGPFDSNQSAADFNNKSALAAYAPMGVHFYTPGGYAMGFYMVDSFSNVVSPTTTVCVCVSGSSSGNNGGGTTPTPDAATIAGYANKAEFNALSTLQFPNATMAATINASVSYQYAPGSYTGNGGIFMHNNTWYPLTVNETVVGHAYSGTVWDVVCMGYGNLSNFTLEVQAPNGTWEVVKPIIIQGYNYFVLGSWNTSDVTHTIHLRYLYTGPSVEYRGNLLTIAPNGDVVGDQLFNPDYKLWQLFNANAVV